MTFKTSFFFHLLLVLCSFAVFSACDKSDSYKVLSERAHQKFLEIKALADQNTCADLDRLSIQKVPYGCGHYFAIHETQLATFNLLTEEYLALQAEADGAKDRPISLYASPCQPNPPLEIVCENGMAKLRYPYEIQDIEKLHAAIAENWESIQHFYDDVPCTNPSDWTSYYVYTGCCAEGIALHKTIRTQEFIEKIYLQNALVAVKKALEKTDCAAVSCNNFFKEVQCVDGKPYVESTKE